MNTEENPLTTLKTNPEDGTELCSQADTKITLQMASDVNENKLNGDNEQSLMENEDLELEDKDVQDSINNNESCNVMCGQLSCKKGCEDYDRTAMDSLASAPFSTKENATTKGKRVSGRRSNRYKKSSNGKSTADADVMLSDDNGFVESAHELATLELSVTSEPRNQKQLRDSLFSLIKEGFEQKDVRMLPTCLHQIAETYFLEEDYEKAMQFIQLERIYHEQLLANLSAIQEQWERKWKTSNPISSSLSQNSEKGLSSHELKRLSTFCSSHQDPQAVKWKVSDKSLRIQILPQLLASAETCDIDGSFTDCPGKESDPGSKTATDRKPGVAVMNLPPDVSSASLITRGADDQALHSQSHKEEKHLSISGATLELHTQPTGTEGRANPDSSFSTGDAGKNNNLLQPEATANSSNVSEIETFSKEGVEEQAESPMVDKLISAATVHSDCVSSTQDDTTGGGSSLEGCSPSTEDPATRDEITDKKWIIHSDSKTGELGQSSESGADQICSRESSSRAQHQAAVEFIASLLNGDLKDSESFLSHLDFQEETFSEEEMSPSPGESVLGDSFLSLDELAKRIEIEEVSPVAGLVSILKKRDGGEGDQAFQSSQKQAKRKVRFQEAEDALEQEEINGGSCILLIALCIVTVFLSIGGTALYCTFGDMDSSVCKDFAANVDFYYTQAVQGIEEIRHWLFVT
ncbi:consortin isoform X1 [Lithobates pipiens]